MNKDRGKSMPESDIQNSFGFSMKSFGSLLSSSDSAIGGSIPPGDKQHQLESSGLLGALSGVKNIMTAYSTSSREGMTNQKVAKTLAASVDKFRIQTPETHLGLVVTYSDSLLSPATNPDLAFSWYRVNPSDGGNCETLSTPSLAPENAWYPPCADDIGNIIRMRCRDKIDLGISRYIDSRPIPVDSDVAARVEEAVTKDRILAKAVVCSSKLYFGRARVNSTGKSTQTRNHKPLQRSGSNGSVGSTGSAHSSSTQGSTSASPGRGDSGTSKVVKDDRPAYQVADIHEFEIAGSIEVGSKGILICEKGVEQGGLRYYPSSKIEVVCCQAASFLLRVPFVDLSGDSSGAEDGPAAHNRLIEWVGAEDGDMHDGICDALSDIDFAECKPSHHRSQSAGSISSNSYDDVRKESSDGGSSSSPPRNTVSGSGVARKRRVSGSSLDFSSRPSALAPIRVLELVISCRDRLTRDCIVLSLRAMAVYDPISSLAPVSSDVKIQRGLSRLPWRHPDYACAQGPGAGERESLKIQQMEREIERLQGELSIVVSSRDEMKDALEHALASKEIAESTATSLQQEILTLQSGTVRDEHQQVAKLLLVQEDEGDCVGGTTKRAEDMATEMEELRRVCQELYSKLHCAEATIVELAAQTSHHSQSPTPTTAPTLPAVGENEVIVHSTSTPEPAMRRNSTPDLQNGVVFPVYEASSGEMVLPYSPEGKAGSPKSPCPLLPVSASDSLGTAFALDSYGAIGRMHVASTDERVALLMTKLRELRDGLSTSTFTAGINAEVIPVEEGNYDALVSEAARNAEQTNIIQDIEELVRSIVRQSESLQCGERGWGGEGSGACGECSESDKSCNKHVLADCTMSGSGMDEYKQPHTSFTRQAEQAFSASDTSRDMDLLGSLVIVSGALKRFIASASPSVTANAEVISEAAGVVTERIDSDECTGETTADVESISQMRLKLAQVVDTIRSQVDQLGKMPVSGRSVSSSKTPHMPTIPTSPTTSRSVRRSSAARKKQPVSHPSDRDRQDGGSRNDIGEEEEREDHDDDEGFASINLVTLEGAVQDDEEEDEEEGLYTRAEMAHVSYELDEALQKCELLQEQVAALEEQKRSTQVSSASLIEHLKGQLEQMENRSGEDRNKADDEVVALRRTIEEQDTAMETFKVSYQKMQMMVNTFKERYNTLAREMEVVKVQLEDNRSRVRQLEGELSVAQQAKKAVENDCMELRLRLTNAEKGAHATQKVQADLDKLSVRLSDERQGAQTAKQNAAKEIRDLRSQNSELSAALSKAKERTDMLEGRLSLLQQETLSLSDARQQLTKQMASYEAMRNQITQMRGQLVQADQEAQVSRTLLSEGSIENEKLRKTVGDMTAEIAALKKSVDKRTSRANDLKQRMDEMEGEKKSIEKDRNSLRKENVRLRASVNTLSEDRATLAKLQPLYNQQLELLATNHSKTSELETINSRARKAYLSTIIQLVSTELQLGIVSRASALCLLESDRYGMCAEDMHGSVITMAGKLHSSQSTITTLHEDLQLARAAEPFAMKKLNYLVAKLNGEKNHYENKAKSLSKDLQRKLLAGTPLQRELGRVTARLEEVENERNAYRDAMVLACDTFTLKGNDSSWFG